MPADSDFDIELALTPCGSVIFKRVAWDALSPVRMDLSRCLFRVYAVRNRKVSTYAALRPPTSYVGLPGGQSRSIMRDLAQHYGYPGRVEPAHAV